MPYADLQSLRNDVNASITTNHNREIEGIEVNRIFNGVIDFIQNNNLEVVTTVGNTTSKNIISAATIQGLNLVTKSQLNGSATGKYLTTDANGLLQLKTITETDITAPVLSIISGQKGIAFGIAPLNANAKIDTAYLPDSILGNVKYKGTYNIVTNVIASDDPVLNGQPLPAASSANAGYYFIVQGSGTVTGVSYNTGDWIISNGTAGWTRIDNSDAVTSVFGRLGNVVAVNGDYNTSQVTELTNLYFTTTRARASLTNGAGINYNSTTGAIALTTTGILAGTYNNISVDIYGRAVNGINVSYELTSNKSSNTSLGTSDTLYPTQNAVKTYVDTAIAGVPTYTLQLVTNNGNTTTNAIIIKTTATVGNVYDFEVGAKVRFGSTFFNDGTNNDTLITIGNAGKFSVRKTTGLADLFTVAGSDGTVGLLKPAYVNLTATPQYLSTDVSGNLIGKSVSWTDVQSKPTIDLQYVTTNGNTTTTNINLTTQGAKIGYNITVASGSGAAGSSWIEYSADSSGVGVTKFLSNDNSASAGAAGGFRFFPHPTAGTVISMTSQTGINIDIPAGTAGGSAWHLRLQASSGNNTRATFIVQSNVMTISCADGSTQGNLILNPGGGNAKTTIGYQLMHANAFAYASGSFLPFVLNSTSLRQETVTAAQMNTFLGGNPWYITGNTLIATGILGSTSGAFDINIQRAGTTAISLVSAGVSIPLPVSLGANTPSAAISFSMNRGMVGTNAYAFYTTASVQTGVTNAYYNRIQLNTTSTGVSDVVAFSVEQGTIAGTIGRTFGFRVDNLTVGTTLIAAFSSALNSSSVSYGLHMAGTAQNLLTGNTGVGGAASATYNFKVTGTSWITSRVGIGDIPDATAIFKVTGNSILTGTLTFTTAPSTYASGGIGILHRNTTSGIVELLTAAQLSAYIANSVVEITGTSQTAVAGVKYIANNAGLVTITLPATANQGDQVLVRGKGAGLWKIAQNSGQTIHGASNTTTGATGYIQSQSQYDTVALECITANTDWIILTNRGTLTIV